MYYEIAGTGANGQKEWCVIVHIQIRKWINKNTAYWCTFQLWMCSRGNGSLASPSNLCLISSIVVKQPHLSGYILPHQRALSHHAKGNTATENEQDQENNKATESSCNDSERDSWTSWIIQAHFEWPNSLTDIKMIYRVGLPLLLYIESMGKFPIARHICKR